MCVCVDVFWLAFAILALPVFLTLPVIVYFRRSDAVGVLKTLHTRCSVHHSAGLTVLLLFNFY